ncbi:MAG: hypothetical protein GTO17_06700 [Candidatus Aminicenantes bacterium]|nr:hypothetical protein [Candidatus Aminicenantes bacterium]
MLGIRTCILFIGALIALCVSPLFSEGIEDDYALVDSITSVVRDDSAQEFVLCHLQPAIWGDYDVEIRVSGDYTFDRKPRIFRLFRGVFSEDVEQNANSLKVHRNGLVQMGSKEEAFARGIPFYIADLVFESHNIVHFTVYSNPDSMVEHAFVRIQQFRKSGSGYQSKLEIVNVREPLSLYTYSQRCTIKVDTYEGWILSIVKSHGTQFCCLISNEVPLQ